MKQDEVLKRFMPEIERWLRYAYSEGNKEGYKSGTEELKRLRSECIRESESKEIDEEYMKSWKDYTNFYGWCSVCKRPHSGRWAHIWSYCPWCGAKIAHKKEDPYPTGLRMENEIVKKCFNLIQDINPDEIKSHDTLESLNGWTRRIRRELEKNLANLEEMIGGNEYE